MPVLPIKSDVGTIVVQMTLLHVPVQSLKSLYVLKIWLSDVVMDLVERRILIVLL